MTETIEISERRRDLHLTEMLLPFYMLFAQYKIGPISIGSLLLILAAFFIYFRNRGAIHFPLRFWPYYLFLAYAIICDLFRALLGTASMQTEINRMIEYIVVFFMVFFICSQPPDEKRLYKQWKIAGIIYALGILFQVVQIYFLNQHISPISLLPGYELRPEDSTNLLRPSSFFAEPSFFVANMLPLLFFSLKQNDYKWAFFCTSVILLSTSTEGIILSTILWAASLTKENALIGKKIIALIVLAPIIWMFFNLNIFSEAQSKLLSAMNGGNTVGSRLLTGFELIKNMPSTDVFFGANYGNVGHYVTDKLSYFSGCETLLRYWDSQRLFLNTFSRLIFQYGIIGLILFFLPFSIYLRQKFFHAKPYVIVMIVAVFGETMLLNAYYFMMVMICMFYDNLAERQESSNNNQNTRAKND